MLEAKAEGRLVKVGPDSPETAQCPACGGMVTKRKRRRMDGQITYFYRHRKGVGDNCPLRYTPVRADR